MERFMEEIKKLMPAGLWQTVLSIVIMALLAFILVKAVNKLFKILLKKGKIDPTPAVLGRRIIKGIIIVLAVCGIMLQFAPMKQFVVSVLASSGIAVVVLGFAAQEAMGNLVSGVFISLFKPFSIGDRIKLQDRMIDGVVEDISMRHTIIRTFENNRVVVPNSVMNGAVIENVNYGENKVCNFVEVGIGYRSDVDRAIAIIQEEAQAHPNFCDNRSEEEIAAGAAPVTVRVMELGDFSIKLRASVWSRNAADGFVLKSDLLLAVKKRFDKEGIEIPFPYVNVMEHSSEK